MYFRSVSFHLLLSWMALTAEASAAEGGVIPLRFSGNFALVDVTIGGKFVPLIFDTGDARGITLPPPVIDHARAQATGQTSRVVDAKGNVIEAPRYRIPLVKIGAIEFKDVLADLEVHDPSYQPDPHGQQGFLGTALFKPYRLVIDYPRKELTLIAPGEARANGAECRGASVPFTGQWNGEPVTEVATDLGRVVLWWDTGTPLSILGKRFAQRMRPEVSEGPWTSRLLTLGEAQSGPWQFEIVDLQLPPGFDGFIGHDFFARHQVCMDFPGKQLFVRK